MTFRKRYLAPVVALIALGSLLCWAYLDVRERTLKDFNNGQMLMAKQAAIGIRQFFDTYMDELTTMASNENVLAMDKAGEAEIAGFFALHRHDITAITRVDPQGRVLASFPPNPQMRGADLSGQAHIRHILERHQPVISDVFTSVQGYRAIAIHVPVLAGNVFQGTVGVLIPFKRIAAKFLENIRIGKEGYAWVLSREGVELFCQVPSHVGNTIFQTSGRFPSVIAMARDMMAGKQGEATYEYDMIKGKAVKTITKIAAYTPVPLYNTHWSIVVATPVDYVLASMKSFTIKMLALGLLLVLFIAVYFFFFVRAWLVYAESQARQKAEAKAAELATIVASSVDSIVGLDLQGNITSWNKAAESLYGYSAEEAIGRHISMIIPKGHPDLTSKIWSKILTGARVEGYETVRSAKDGHLINISLTVSPILDKAGNPVGISGISRDITARKRAERALQSENTRRRMLMDASRDGIAIFNQEHQVVEANQRFCEMLGYSLEEVLNLHTWDFEATMSQEEIRASFSNLAKTNFTFETRHRRKDGSLYDVEVSASGALVDGQPLVVTISRDISARKQNERERLQSEEKFRLAFNTSPDAININRLEDGLYIEINQGFIDLTGFTAEDVVGKTSLEIDIWVDPEDRAKLVRGLREKGYYDNLEAEFRRKDGSLTTALMSARVISLNGVPHIISITRDISQRIRAEQDKARLEDQLRQAQKMEALGTLAGGIAHDFNNILGAILGYAEIARDDARMGQANPDDINQIIRATDRAKNLVQQILTFSRKVEPERKVLDLNQEVGRAVDLLGHTLPKMVSTELRLSPAINRVNADPIQLSQIILNLATNASHAMPDGGRITISTENCSVEDKICPACGATYSGDWVALAVSDTGQGIHLKDLPKIFDPFFTTKEVGKGTGLGLATVHGIVLSHGGHVECQSELGRGTIFTIYLPIEIGVAEPSKNDSVVEPDNIPGGNETILLVDDEESLRLLGTRTLKSQGYEVTTASSGEMALEVYRQNWGRIDLVVLDLGMPGMGGQKALKAILEFNPRARVIIASGYAAYDQVQVALDAGGRGYVPKPFKKAELLATVRSVLDEN